MITIYALVDPRDDSIRYLGKTVAPQRRLQEHLAYAKRNARTHRDHWLRQLIALGLRPKYLHLAVVNDDEWQAAEQYWIAFLREMGCPLTNHTDGGEGHHGHSPSDETREKMSAAARGRSVPEEQRERQCRAMSGRKLTLEHREKVIRTLRHEPIDKAHREAMTAARRAKALQAGYLGVSRRKTEKNPWRARIHVGGRDISLGCFATAIDAARAYNEAAVRYFGPDAQLNDVQEA